MASLNLIEISFGSAFSANYVTLGKGEIFHYKSLICVINKMIFCIYNEHESQIRTVILIQNCGSVFLPEKPLIMRFLQKEKSHCDFMCIFSRQN